ncbi:DUF262 domain-containing protein [Brevibacterium sp. 2SA]|uniref:DUF262 domain-containing protein n=1 Tax=Brevibacterium sp. 2SA TaxID=2502198 RepID=UPI0010F5AE3E|nr:DUF262 domain-containing protein [Brevibacterium sp. 2SA]
MTELYDRVVDRAREIRTDAYSMSIGEVISLYRDGDIEIHPEFQRIFRWEVSQRSRLIESILLGIPIPTIFVAQREDGVWDVIDGVQRLSTILEFVGEYQNEEGERQPPSVLRGGEYLQELEGVGWNESATDARETLDERLQRDFKRAKLSFSIIKRESDPNAKFDLFQRLNAGSTLSLQEARNCLLIMINRDAFHRLSELSRYPQFSNCISVSEQKENAAYKSELVLRFFCEGAYEGGTAQLTTEFGSYLTDWMKKSAESDAGFLSGDKFRRTFDLLNDATGPDTFRRFDGSRHVGPFSISSYEFITSGVASNLEFWENQTSDELTERVQKIWKNKNFSSNSGTGVSSRKRFPQLVVNARKFFASS